MKLKKEFIYQLGIESLRKQHEEAIKRLQLRNFERDFRGARDERYNINMIEKRLGMIEFDAWGGNDE